MSFENIFDEVENIKDRVKAEILQNQNILKLVGISKPNSLSHPDIENPYDLVDKNIYFKPRIFDQTIKEIKTFLLTDVSINSIRNRSKFADVRLSFMIIVHNKLFELEDGKTRSYQIAKYITEAFNEKEGSWTGKCVFEGCSNMDVPTDYQGINVVFTMTDFK